MKTIEARSHLTSQTFSVDFSALSDEMLDRVDAMLEGDKMPSSTFQPFTYSQASTEDD